MLDPQLLNKYDNNAKEKHQIDEKKRRVLLLIDTHNVDWLGLAQRSQFAVFSDSETHSVGCHLADHILVKLFGLK